MYELVLSFKVLKASISISFHGKILPSFQLKNYDFNLYNGFFMRKMAHICHISRGAGESKLSNFNDKFQ
jgi:hypothetical protein